MEREAGLLDHRSGWTKRRGPLTRDETGWTEQRGAFIVHLAPFIVGEGPEEKRPSPFMERPGGFIERPTGLLVDEGAEVVLLAPEFVDEIGGMREERGGVLGPSGWLERGAGLLDRRADRTKRRGRWTREETGWTEQEGASAVRPTPVIADEGPEEKRPRPSLERPTDLLVHEGGELVLLAPGFVDGTGGRLEERGGTLGPSGWVEQGAGLLDRRADRTTRRRAAGPRLAPAASRSFEAPSILKKPLQAGARARGGSGTAIANPGAWQPARTLQPADGNAFQGNST